MDDALRRELLAARSPEDLAAIVAERLFATLPEAIALLARRCSLLHWFNAPIIEALSQESLSTSEVSTLCEQFRSFPMVETLPWGLAYNKLTREALLHRYSITQPELLKATARLAAPVYRTGRQRRALSEAFFCSIVAGETAAARELLDELLMEAAKRGDWEYIGGLMRIQDEAERLPFVQPLPLPAVYRDIRLHAHSVLTRPFPAKERVFDWKAPLRGTRSGRMQQLLSTNQPPASAGTTQHGQPPPAVNPQPSRIQGLFAALVMGITVICVYLAYGSNNLEWVVMAIGLIAAIGQWLLPNFQVRTSQLQGAGKFFVQRRFGILLLIVALLVVFDTAVHFGYVPQLRIYSPAGPPQPTVTATVQDPLSATETARANATATSQASIAVTETARANATATTQASIAATETATAHPAPSVLATATASVNPSGFTVTSLHDGQVIPYTTTALTVKGTYLSQGTGTGIVWVLLRDQYGYYLQNPPVNFQLQGTWVATNINLARTTYEIDFYYVTSAANAVFQGMVQKKAFGAFTKLPDGCTPLQTISITVQ